MLAGLHAPNHFEEVDELLIASRPETSSVFEVSLAYRDLVAGRSALEETAIRDELDHLVRLGFLHQPGTVSRTSMAASLTLHLVHGCNLACTYCNVKQGTYGDAFQLMSFKTAQRAFDRFVPRDALSDVCFFGGEPLMNWTVLVRLVEYGQSLSDRQVRWSVVTNGTLLDLESARKLARLGVEVCISVDGSRADHDRNRRTLGGAGSYDATLRGVAAAVEANVRGTLHATHDSSGASYQERFDHLASLGRGRLEIVVAPETATGNYRRGFGDQGAQWGQKLRASWRAGDRSLPGYITSTVNLVLHGEKAERQDCPAGATNVNVTPSGDVFACHISAARKQYRLGNLNDVQLANPDPLGRAPLPKACRTCWANGLCSHGCPIRRSAGIEPSHDECETYREPIRCAAYYLMMAKLEDVENLWVVDAQARRRLGRAWAVRDALRTKNRHIRPLALFPSTAS